MKQDIKFLKINVQLNNVKSSRPSTGSSGSSTPLRSSSAQSPLPSFNGGVDDLLNSVPEPLRDALNEVFSTLSLGVASKAASASPVLGDLVECLAKMGQSYMSPVSQSGPGADSNIPVRSSESPSAPSAPTVPIHSKDGGLRVVLPKMAAINSTCKPSKDANTGNVGKGAGVPAAVDLNVDPPADANLFGSATMTSGASAPNVPAHNDKKNTKESNGHNKGKSVSFETSTPLVDTSRNSYSMSECPFSGVPVANNAPVPPCPYNPGKRSFASTGNVTLTDGNVMFGTFHKGIQCDGCGVLPITGPRFKSKVKDDYDLCSICFSKMGNEADYIRMDRPVHCRPWGFRASNDHIPRVGGTALPHILRNRVMKTSRKLDSRFVLDVNVLDGTGMAPSTPFTKIWRMHNNGTLPWPRGTQLVWIGGDKFSDTTSVDLEIPADDLVRVDGELDIAVDFTAPQLPGRYVSYWRMATQSGIKFGQRVWVLIHVDPSLMVVSENIQGLNLNLPPESSGPRDSEIVDMNVDLVSELCNFIKDPGTVKPMVNELPKKEQLGYNVPTSIPPSSSVSYINDQIVHVPVSRPPRSSPSATYPSIDQGVSAPAYPQAPSSAVSYINDQIVHVPVSLPSRSSPSAAYPSIDQGVSAPAYPQTSSSSVSYPIIDLSEEAPAGPPQAPPHVIWLPASAPAVTQETSPAIGVQAPIPATSVQVPSPAISVQGQSQEDSENDAVEQTLLKELEEMGFKQVDLNKEILRMNEYDLEKSVDDLCGVAEWDPILEELQEMGFCDAETNKKLLKKNNGSIKAVVMDLLSGDRA
ncbi:Zinc finger, ZZ-type [Corchorus olitorius]|uniref:Zinc finger, ZZ-type n=1 Tax=Corchorus olitorius TaxID=93759 RepID=A0A1R3G5N1_9ROSI|nr:Zinc finger, ZZ-type [Corchorus olitorius]